MGQGRADGTASLRVSQGKKIFEIVVALACASIACCVSLEGWPGGYPLPPGRGDRVVMRTSVPVRVLYAVGVIYRCQGAGQATKQIMKGVIQVTFGWNR